VDLKEFKRLYKKFSSKSSNKDVWESKEYSDYINSMNEDEIIGDWYLKQQIKISKVKVGLHCCTKMAYYLTFDKRTKDVNPDAIIRFHKKSRDYGIPIHDGGSSFIEIEFCPWCGAKLTK
jgi:hypothetical protein